MQAFILLALVAAAVAMPWDSAVSSGWQPQAVAHAPVAYAQVSQPIIKQIVQQPQLIQHQVVQPQLVQHVQPQIVHAAPQYVQAAPQYVHAPQVIKAVAPAASSYASFSQVHVSHPAPIVKQVIAQPVYAQPIVKQVVAQPVYTQQVVKQVVAQPVYTQVAQPVLKQYVSAQPAYSHNSW